jgi:MoxR-like ATPase
VAKSKDKKYEVIVKITKSGNKMVAHELNTATLITEKIPYGARKWAFDEGYPLGKTISKAGNTFWRKVDSVPESYAFGDKPNDNTDSNEPDLSGGYKKLSDDEIRTMVANAYSKKPATLELPELQWKLAARALLRGENIIFLGASGGGKTLTARTLAEVYNRPFFKFNLGAMSDARTSLIGNCHYDPEKGTFFAQSDFVTAIQTPGACILLDEMTRMSNDAENILLTPLDADQRYMRIDENPNSPVVNVAEGVCFFATANVGTEYTSTRTIDRATKDRFTTMVDIPLLTEDKEYNLLKLLYPKVNKELLKGVSYVAWYTRENMLSEEPDLSTIISTRSTVEQVALLIDGFKFTEVMEAIVFPMYDNEGGVESERAHMKTLVQGKSDLDREYVYPNQKPVEVVNTQEASDENLDDLFDQDRDAFQQ